MNYSVREAKANFAQALSLAVNGERVVITKHGKPFAEIVPTRVVPATETLWDRLGRARKELGITSENCPWPDHFNDAAFSRRVMGIEE